MYRIAAACTPGFLSSRGRQDSVGAGCLEGRPVGGLGGIVASWVLSPVLGGVVAVPGGWRSGLVMIVLSGAIGASLGVVVVFFADDLLHFFTNEQDVSPEPPPLLTLPLR